MGHWLQISGDDTQCNSKPLCCLKEDLVLTNLKEDIGFATNLKEDIA